MKAYQQWSGSSQNTMSSCWTGTRACPRYYYKKQFQLPVWNLNGNRMKKAKPCIAYVMHEDRRLGCPDAEYFELLHGGYSDWEFPLDTLKRGLAASIGRTEAVRYLKKRQMM